MYILFILFCYILGSIPSGWWLTKIFTKKDIRNVGSGNIGFSNVLRTQSKILALFTIICDVLKTIIPLFLARRFFPDINLLLIGLIVFFGHIFSIFLSFRGGKGIAVLFAIILFLFPIIGLIAMCCWLFILKFTKNAGLTSLVVFSGVLIFFMIKYSQNLLYYIIFLIAIFYTHKVNISNLLQKKSFQ